MLILLAIPVLSLRLGFSDESNFEADTTTKKAYDLLVEGFGPGFNGPLLLVTEVPEGTDVAQLSASVSEAIAADPGVVFVSPGQPNDPANPTAVVWTVVPTTSPQDEATTALVNRLRDDVLPPAEEAAGVDVAVTGNVAVNVDFSDYLASRMPYFFGAVLAAVLPPADGRVPVAARAAEGRDHEPAVDRCRVRRRRRAVPVGLGRRAHRHRNPGRSSRGCR